MLLLLVMMVMTNDAVIMMMIVPHVRPAVRDELMSQTKKHARLSRGSPHCGCAPATELQMMT
jgi:hypothetical protein